MRLLILLLLLLPVVGAAQSSVDCIPGVDVVNEWQKEKHSVVLIGTRGKHGCTGTIINNTALDGRMMILSAGHCYKRNDDLYVWFNHEEGQVTHYTKGVKTLFWLNNRDVDVWLMEVTGEIPDTDIYYAGWSRHDGEVMHDISALSPKEKAIYHLLTDGREAEGRKPYACIQHPQGAKKRIALAARKKMYSSRISHVWWEWGSTAPGSSGSPVFDSRGLITNMLVGGGSACGNNSHDRLENFDNLYSYIKKWLDPDGLDLMELPGMPKN